MDKPLVVITVNQAKNGVKYNIECANHLTSQDIAHFLDEIIEGMCTFKPEVCAEVMQTITGTIPKKS